MNIKKERPILFTTEMVQAILKDVNPKEQTRRTNGLDSINDHPNDWRYCAVDSRNSEYVWQHKTDIKRVIVLKCPYGQANDILWVRETWSLNPFYDKDNNAKYLYAATDKPFENHKWKPSIHMPKEACRLRLKIKSIQVERLIDISEQDAIAEGIKVHTFDGQERYLDYTSKQYFLSAIYSYFSLWDKINGKDSHKKNPWVWVVEFEVMK